MIKINLEKVFGYINKLDFSVHVDDFDKWEEIPNFQRFSSMEGNGISATNGAQYEPQYAYVRLGNNIVAKMKDWNNEDEDFTLKLGDLFPRHDVVIQTSNQALEIIAPIFSKKSEVIRFIAQAEACYKENKDSWSAFSYNWLEGTAMLVKFLYLNNPNKVIERTIYDF